MKRLRMYLEAQQCREREKEIKQFWKTWNFEWNGKK